MYKEDRNIIVSLVLVYRRLQHLYVLFMLPSSIKLK